MSVRLVATRTHWIGTVGPIYPRPPPHANCQARSPRARVCRKARAGAGRPPARRPVSPCASQPISGRAAGQGLARPGRQRLAAADTTDRAAGRITSGIATTMYRRPCLRSVLLRVNGKVAVGVSGSATEHALATRQAVQHHPLAVTCPALRPGHRAPGTAPRAPRPRHRAPTPRVRDYARTLDVA